MIAAARALHTIRFRIAAVEEPLAVVDHYQSLYFRGVLEKRVYYFRVVTSHSLDGSAHWRAPTVSEHIGMLVEERLRQVMVVAVRKVQVDVEPKALGTAGDIVEALQPGIGFRIVPVDERLVHVLQSMS